MKTFIAKATDFKLSRKLPLIITIAAIATAAIVGIFAYRETARELNLDAENLLSASLQARKEEFARYMDSIEKDLHFNSVNPLVVQAQQKFAQAWQDLVKNVT